MSKQIKIEIKNRWTGNILFEYLSENNTIKKTVSEAIKSGADLREADLRDADLSGADLREADLSDADLSGANLRGAKGAYMACPTDGSFIGWKKVEGFIVKLQIPEDARRSSAYGEKCRCNKAYVVEIQNIDGTRANIETVHSYYASGFAYTVGTTVEVADFDDCRWNECAPGIHFFIDRRAAVEY
nr:MAG TPA: pentapeptide repeat protein [Caudoviricetes sp.]